MRNERTHNVKRKEEGKPQVCHEDNSKYLEKEMCSRGSESPCVLKGLMKLVSGEFSAQYTNIF